MNGKDGLLHSTEETFNKSFTFATYIFIDEWVPGAYIFKKQVEIKCWLPYN